MDKPFEVLFNGFPGKSSRGFLGWSSVVLLKHGPFGLFDTAGFGERVELANRLQAQNIPCQEIQFIILSHFHFDHVANISLFPQATVYLHEHEVRHILEETEQDPCIPIELFYALQASNRLVILHGEEGEIEGLEWFRAPGHTPGSISVRFIHQNETWVLAADAIKNLLEAQTGEVWMSMDREASMSSIRKIINQADWVVPGHDRLLHISRNSNSVEISAMGQIEMKIELAKNYPGRIVSHGSRTEQSGDFVTLEIGESVHGI